MITFKKQNLFDLQKQAIEAGAVRRVSHVIKPWYSDNRFEEFSWHFFDKDWNEVALIIVSEDLYEYVGIQMFNPHRKWDINLLISSGYMEDPEWLENMKREIEKEKNHES